MSFLNNLITSLSPYSVTVVPLVVKCMLNFSARNMTGAFLRLVFFILNSSIIFSVVKVLYTLANGIFVSVNNTCFVLFVTSFIVMVNLGLLGMLSFSFPIFVGRVPGGSNGGLLLCPFVMNTFFTLTKAPYSAPVLVTVVDFTTLTGGVFLTILVLFLFTVNRDMVVLLMNINLSGIGSVGSLGGFSSILLGVDNILLVLTSVCVFCGVFTPCVMGWLCVLWGWRCESLSCVVGIVSKRLAAGGSGFYVIVSEFGSFVNSGLLSNTVSSLGERNITSSGVSMI